MREMTVEDAREGFTAHAALYVLVMAALIVLNLFLTGVWWFVIPLVGWGIVLALHYLYRQAGGMRPDPTTLGSWQRLGWLVTGWALGSAVRRLSQRTGVTDAEAHGTLPGDEVIAHPMVEWTRGVTVQAPPERIWPWLVQMGYGRAGWYTPEWVDRITPGSDAGEVAIAVGT